MAMLTTHDGRKLYYDVEGEGPALLLISGLGGSATFWDDSRKELSRHFTTISFDHCGTGRSAGADGPHSIEQIASDVIAVLDELGLPSASVVGHSTGGVVTQVLAHRSPERCERLVISGSWLQSDEQFRLLFLARRALLNDWPNYQRLTYALGYPPSWIAANDREVRAAIQSKPGSLQVLSARIDMLLNIDLSKITPQISKPMLVIGATDDAIVPFHHSQQVAASVLKSTLRNIDGGHFFPRSNTRAFLDATLPFLRSA